MSYRYWRSNLALRRLAIGVAAAFAIGHGVAVALPESLSPQRYAQADSDDAKRPMSARPSEQKKASTYKADCEKPADREEADLCEQRRMAKAAEELVTRTDRQIWLSNLEIGGLFTSAFFTAVAAIAAAWAAIAAERAVRVSQDTAKQELRAYISIETDTVYNWKKFETLTIMARVHAHNHGQTPGADTKYDFGMAILDSDIPSDYYFGPPDRCYDANDTIFPGSEIPVFLFYNRRISKEEHAAIEAGRKRFHTWGILHYVDVFKEPRTTKFSFSFGGPEFAARMGGDQTSHWSWQNNQGHNDAT